MQTPEENRHKLIETYIHSYNRKDIEGMLGVLHPTVVFENYVNGQKTHQLEGIRSFEKQARDSFAVFAERKQEILEQKHLATSTQVKIHFTAILAIDLPDQNLEAGQWLSLEGISIFEFKNQKISMIQDFSTT